VSEAVERERGTVVSFDAAAGVGEIETANARVPFHCTALADGTRVISRGAEVEFDVVPGVTGRWEAAAITRR
jgi:cold shock CspA family protein